MNIVLVPPVTDPTTEVVIGPTERLWDVNERFMLRAADPRSLRALAEELDTPTGDGPGPVAQAQLCLLALAAADVLTEPPGSCAWLRGFGAAVRVLSSGDAGLTATIDDIELRTGSTQSSTEVARAAALCALFDPELDELHRRLGARAKVHVVLDSDQQLPAALRLLGRLGPSRSVTVEGRFVRQYEQTLRRVPGLLRARFSTRIRRRIVRPPWAPDRQQLHWVAFGESCPGEGPWAGWMDAAQLRTLDPSELDRCQGLVVSVPSGHPGQPPEGGQTLSRDVPAQQPGRLVRLIQELRTRIPVAVEIVVAGPVSAGAEEWWQRDPEVRVAGFRPYRPEISGHWQSGTGLDLARWSAPASEDARHAIGDLLASSGPGLFPGRLAGALFARDEQRPIGAGYCWDPAVRLVTTRSASPDGTAPGSFLVNLRSGSITRVNAALATQLGRVRLGGLSAARAISAIPPGPRDRLFAGLHRAGVLSREVTAA